MVSKVGPQTHVLFTEGNCPEPIHAQDTVRKLGVERVPIQTTKTLQGVRAFPTKEGVLQSIVTSLLLEGNNEDQPVPGTVHVTWDTAMIQVVSHLGILSLIVENVLLDHYHSRR